MDYIKPLFSGGVSFNQTGHAGSVVASGQQVHNGAQLGAPGRASVLY